jgi:hypothetical protein
MAKEKTPPIEKEPFVENTTTNKEDLLTEVTQHYNWWTDDNERRAYRDNGWKDITDAYWGQLPDDWPFISRTTDPRIRTSLIEKNSRLTNRSLKGRVTPREGGDVIRARIQNSLVEYQWDAANHGGSMNQKISTCDMDTRLYQSKFAYVPWKIVKEDKDVIFEGNEFEPADINECGLDPNCDHIRNAKWFQRRFWIQWEDIENNKEIYTSWQKLKDLMESSKDTPKTQKRRDNKWTSRVKQIKGLEDRMGTDNAFPVLPIVIEYRNDKWIYFCPDYNIILGVHDNPYDHHRIPYSQLRYYSTNGDNLGESEVETVLPLWRAIQACLCAYLDEVIIKMRPPLKVVEGAARVETLVYEPEAHWLMDNVNAVTEMESRADSIRYFTNTYPALIAAFNQAMGDLSQGVSNLDPNQSDKTATEVNFYAKQQNSRDQKNQQELSEFLKDIVSMWISNNKQFLFRDPSKAEYILRIVGQDAISYFKRVGMDQMETPAEAMQYIRDIVEESVTAGQPLGQQDIAGMLQAASIPKFPVVSNPEEKNKNKINLKAKLSVSELGDYGELSVVPEDLDGLYDYIPDVRSMEANSSGELMIARNQAIQLLSNPNILQLLTMQGVTPNMKELMIASFEDQGLVDAQKFFETQSPQGQGPVAGVPPQGVNPTGGTIPAVPNGGMGNTPQTPTQSSVVQQVARPNQIPQ